MNTVNRPRIRRWTGQKTAWVQHKLDGHMVLVRNGVPYTRTWKPLAQWLVDVHGFELKGSFIAEAHVPGKRSEDVPTALRDPESGLRLAVLAVFGMSVTASLEDVNKWAQDHGLDYPTLLRGDDFSSYQEVERYVEEQKIEGLVFKDGNLLNWYKYKPTKTADLQVVGLTDGTGKYLGLLGALICATREGTIVARVSGMTEDQRLDMSLDPPIGKIVEVEYQNVGNGGRLRHPRFIRFRPDKDVADSVSDL